MTGGYRRLSEADVQVGKPLSLSVSDASGVLLLKIGHVVANEAQRRRLLAQRVFISLAEEQARTALRPRQPPPRAETKPATISVFDWVEAHYQLLADVYLKAHNPESNIIPKIQLLANRIMRVSETHSDGLLAAVQMADNKVYTFIKALHVALLCDALGRRAGMIGSLRLSLVSAALTLDLAVWREQEQLRVYRNALTDDHWQMIRRHPHQSAELLANAGAVDGVWLMTVEQHHERLDGSGYPLGLNGSGVGQTARVAAVADTFASVVRSRGDRSERLPKEAIRDLFLARGETIDAVLVQLFIKELGLFPPGSAVLLATGEQGIVTGAGRVASSPDVDVVIDAQGQPLTRSIYRDTTQKEYAVTEIIGKPAHPKLNALLPDMWPKLNKLG